MDQSNFVLAAVTFCPRHCGGVYIICSDNSRRGFGSHLCAWLRSKGIKIMNDEAFPRENAFRRSNVVIMIISKEYPTSKHCLDDLEMIEKYGENKEILAVCYHIRSEDIEKSFENAFTELGSNFPEQMVNIWRHRFRKIVEKDRYRVNIDRNESEIVEDIARDVCCLMQCVCGVDAQQLTAPDWFSSQHGGGSPFSNEYPEGVEGECEATVVEADEIPSIESDNAFVSTTDLSIGSAQTQDCSWSDLQHDLLTKIAMKLHAFHDFAVFSSVCPSWRSVCSDLNWSLCPPHPWSIHFQHQNILNDLDDGRYVLQRWEIHGRYYYGCVKGWILNIGSQHIHLFNLFSRVQTEFPMLGCVGDLSITNPYDWYNWIEKFILFKACEVDDYPGIAVALFGRKDLVAFSRTSYQEWEFVINSGMGIFRDVLLFQGQFYALCGRGRLVHCTFERSHSSLSLLSQRPVRSFRADRYYLVKNADHMIGLFQFGNANSGNRRFKTTDFRIYRFETDDWTQILQPHYLEGRALFIDNGNSWTLDPMEVQNCRSNSIYFTDEYWITNDESGHYTGMYDIAKRDFKEFQPEEHHHPSNSSTPFLLTFNDGS